MTAAVVAVATMLFVACTDSPGTKFSPSEPVPVADGRVIVDFEQPLAVISPLIRGVSGPIENFEGAGVTLNSWGGLRATRYNFQLGNAWNLGRSGAFRNEGVASTTDLVGDWLAANSDAGVRTRVAAPGLGWIAKDARSTTCSFPDVDGACRTVEAVNCLRTGVLADPTLANVGSSPQTVGEWIARYGEQGIAIDYVAVDNEPERWGVEHYDVHPSCTRYEEVLGVYLAYGAALRASAPDAQLTGPVMCCWFGYDGAPGPPDPGPSDGSGDHLLSWFLRSLSEREDATTPERLIDVADVHFRPRSDVVNSRNDTTANEARLEAVRDLWDPTYAGSTLSVGTTTSSTSTVPDDEGQVPVEFIPRMRRTIDTYYPNLPLMISDWSFGNTESINGGLVIARALGVFAREGIEAAAHADTIEPGTPGWYAFKMFGNYDDRGGAFEGTAYEVAVRQLPNIEAYAALGDDDVVRIVVVNAATEAASRVAFDIGGIRTVGAAAGYTYSQDDLGAIVRSTIDVDAGESAVIPAGSITVVAIQIDRPVGSPD